MFPNLYLNEYFEILTFNKSCTSVWNILIFKTMSIQRKRLVVKRNRKYIIAHKSSSNLV